MRTGRAAGLTGGEQCPEAAAALCSQPRVQDPGEAGARYSLGASFSSAFTPLSEDFWNLHSELSPIMKNDGGAGGLHATTSAL